MRPALYQLPGPYLTWPNVLSLLRLLLVPPFVVLMLNQQEQGVYRHVALGIFLLMGFSDFIDGCLARKYQLTSRLGAILDPIADKALIICSAVLLNLPYSCVPNARLPNWVVVAIVGKDLWVIVGFVIMFLLTGGLHVRPTIFGKISTVGQIAMVAAVLLSPDLNSLGGQAGLKLAKLLWSLVTLLCVLAIFSYTRLGYLIIAEAEAKRRDNQAK